MILFILLNLIDAIATYIGLTSGKCEEAKNYYNLAKKFGIKIKIPNEVWQQAESAIKSNTHNNPRSNGGFRF